MATTSIPNSDHTHDFDATAERVRDLGERVVAEGRSAGLNALEAYEKSAWGVADFQARLAKSTQVDWVSNVLEAQADLTRTVVVAQTSAVRQLLK